MECLWYCKKNNGIDIRNGVNCISMILFRTLHIHEHTGQRNFEPRGFDQVQCDSDKGDFDQYDFDQGNFDSDRGDFDQHDFDQGDFDQCDFDQGDFDQRDFDQRLSAGNFEHFPSDFVSLLKFDHFLWDFLHSGHKL